MKQMDTEHLRIYIREAEKDIFYQLEDIRSERWIDVPACSRNAMFLAM